MKRSFASGLRVPIVALQICVLLAGMVPHSTSAAALNTAPAAKVSFTFDDGLASAATQAQPTLAKYGLTGTDYVITGCVGMTQVPNTCRANTTAPYMTWAQVQALQSSGWEIGSHTVNHNCLSDSAATDPDDCQRKVLTSAQVASELSDSKNALAAHGIAATDFSAPYGDYDTAVLAQVAKYYATMRGFKDENNNTWPYDDYLINDVRVQETTTTVADIKAKVDQAIADKTWLVLTFHDIVPSPSADPDDYQYATAELDQIAAYVAAKQNAGLIRSVRVDQGAVSSTSNLLANGSFNAGGADGWTTDSPATITKDTAGNGSYPDATNAIKMVSAAGGASKHLFSPKVAVDPYTTYMFKNFLNVQTLTTGQVGFYVDEYDANNNWISGQYLKQENSAFVESMNFPYTPSSVTVSKASLQVIIGGTGITAYLDNSQMFALSTVAKTNRVSNGTFDAGIANGWTTDAPAAITANSQNNGSPANPVNSVSLTATAANTHLFSPKVAVNANTTYSLTAYLNLRALNTNEVGFYVDEYDANNNWISGTYVSGVRALGAGNVGITYKPSSTAVVNASLQVIVPGGSGTGAYLDDVKWY